MTSINHEDAKRLKQLSYFNAYNEIVFDKSKKALHISRTASSLMPGLNTYVFYVGKKVKEVTCKFEHLYLVLDMTKAKIVKLVGESPDVMVGTVEEQMLKQRKSVKIIYD